MDAGRRMRARGSVGSRHGSDPCHVGRGNAQGAGERRLSPEAIEMTAERLRVVAEPNRIGIMATLNQRGEASVQELADCLGAPHQRISKHLSVLHYAGIVSRSRREGAAVLYRLIDWSGWWVVEQTARWVGSGLEEDEEATGGSRPAAADRPV